VAERPAVNTSPLIVLAKGGWLDLLRLAGERVVVPRAVWDEIAAYTQPDPTLRAVSLCDWIEVVEAPEPSQLILA
jgi:predicted nucleic acid-binding protein